MLLSFALASLLVQRTFALAVRSDDATASFLDSSSTQVSAPTNSPSAPSHASVGDNGGSPTLPSDTTSLPPNYPTDLPSYSSVASYVDSATLSVSVPTLSTSPLPYAPTNIYSSGSPQPTGGTCAPYWLENIKHQGLAPFNTNTTNGTYPVFRNVKDFGAKGDGLADDTAAIQKAISVGNRCAPGSCNSTTTTPAIVYFPEGTYVISSAIVDYYYTQIIGNPNCLPILQAASNFSGYTDPSTNITTAYIIDSDPYNSNGQLSFGATNVFFRQVRNFIFDTTKVAAGYKMIGIHWPSSQTTSLQNLAFKLSAANGTLHEGVFVEQGSGGFMTDLVFYGGNIGFDVGNQQFTTRNLTFYGCRTAIQQSWDWGWTYKSVSINKCQLGFNLSVETPNTVVFGSVTLLDSSITDTPIAILTSRSSASQPDAAGALYMENVQIENVKYAVQGPNGTIYLQGSSSLTTIDAWADGHRYVPAGGPDFLPQGPQDLRGPIARTDRPVDLLDDDGTYYEQSKPQYESYALESFISARDHGAKGDAVTDDTEALNSAVQTAVESNKILFIDAGYYKVSSTFFIPPGAKIVGEALATIIMSSGDFFNNINTPQPVVQVGRQGDQGVVELSDLLVSPQGPQAGAILIEYNLGTYDDDVSGMWDVHTRIGGYAGSQLQIEQCPTTPNVTVTIENYAQQCVSAYMAMHITQWARGLYMENNWLWTADHDIDDPDQRQITLYTGRGLLIEGINGVFWLYGTAVEHASKYQYQLLNTRNIFMGQIQTETAYYQPNPDATVPFPTNPILGDPVFTPSSNSSVHAAEGFGVRIVQSDAISIYGAGLYSFFDNYNVTCSNEGQGARCQTRILSIEGEGNDLSGWSVAIYNLNTVGSINMITQDGVDVAKSVDNNSTYVDTVNVFRTGHQ